MVATALTLSCEENPDTPSNGGGQDASGRRVSRVDYYSGKSTYTDSMTYQYEYDAQGRLASMVGKLNSSSSGTYTFTYPNTNTIVMGSDASRDAIMTLNGEGYIASIQYEGRDKPSVLTYANGYLQKEVVFIYDEMGNTTDSAISTYSWVNGNITKMLSEMFVGTSRAYTEATTYEYGNTPNKPSSIDIAHIILGTYSALLPRGWFGKSPANMPSKITTSCGSTSTITMRYETDSAGYVLKVFEQQDGNAETLRCEVSYE